MNFESLALKVVTEAAGKLATPSELKALAKLQAAWEEAWKCMNAHGIDSAYLAYMQHREQLVQSVSAGKISAEDGWSRAEWEEDFAIKAQAAKDALRRYSKAASPLTRQITERFCETANAAAGRVEKEEAKVFAEWAFPYSPSPLVEALKRLPALARQRIPNSEYCETSPQDQISYIKL